MTRFLKVTYALVVSTTFGCTGAVDGIESDPAPAATRSLSAADQAEVLRVKAEIRSAQDRQPLYSLLAARRGDLSTLLAICDQFEATYCLKMASKQNPEHRRELCDELSRRLEGAHPAKSLAGHAKDCSVGMPQFSY